MIRGCPTTGRLMHKFDPVTHRCVCGRWERGFKPKKECVKPRAECQICECEQALDPGLHVLVMTHHGYKRPGCGFIVSDCMGVAHAPYPATDALIKYKAMLQGILLRTVTEVEELPRAQKLPYTYTTGRMGTPNRQKVTVMIKRGDDTIYLGAEHGHQSIPSFAAKYEWERSRLEEKIDQLKREMNRVVRRIDNAKKGDTP